ncbi:hypothetical protein Nepgr_028190 [Nepenthes gracilis]|uniref:TF-B3 domain-containing protein n=1 Tax=Nepenthes gracilis TaxID=150966 RepID=A0AAD3TBH4_NEPGR|nr:hypothetical protein Nepgr_028190 [Nepenthes gracilis]
MEPCRNRKSRRNDGESEFNADISSVNEREVIENYHQIIHGNYVGQPLMEKVPMFEKPLTPSDVGKLNRLVIPKQHAEKYFPLSGDSGDKGLLLSFEDDSGKSWRFRYSYWNSSQSYVLTRGWSRYVKEKRLDAGDVVLFQRHRADSGRLFIDWRRPSGGSDCPSPPVHGADFNGLGGGGGGRQVDRSGVSYNAHPYQPDYCLHAADSIIKNQKTSSSTSGNSKRLRLFGVNLDCRLDGSEPQSSHGSPLSSHGPPLDFF